MLSPMKDQTPEEKVLGYVEEPDSLQLHLLLAQNGLKMASDELHVQWAMGNRRHPRNWSIFRKAYDISLVVFLELFTANIDGLFRTAVSTAGSTAAGAAAVEFGLGKTLSIFYFVSVYLIGQAIGGILFPPYSEAFGRKKLYVVSTALYSISCLVVAAVPSLIGVVLGRFVSGLLSAIPTTVVIGSIEDMFNSRDRIWMVCIWAIVSNLGLVVGPIMSIYVLADLEWRWLFYIATIVTGVLTFLLLSIRESRPSLILAREVAKLRQATNIDSLEAVNPDHAPDLRSFARVALARPLFLLITEPIVFIVSLISAIAIALVYLFTEALPPIYESFGFRDPQSSLPFVAIGVGLSLGLLTRCLDLYIIDQHRQQGRVLLPEHKLLGLWLGAPILAGALWVFAWTIPPAVRDLHWIVSAIALGLVGYSLNELDYVLGGYLTDSYLSYASSGFSALSFLRSILSAVFPLVSTYMFSALGANLAVTVLAAMATVFCIVPPLFTRHGESLRARSNFARQSLSMYHQYSVDEHGY
ncbi:putative MFS multidrug transporter [Aspergillus clavatus NRRL 1]|uniref:MFS transporter, putative n=1 Tax=Aspergillus clavatus (strain ATCC 1007 / CBS 513.65 / DSM 816 / NCTC 3887 / NRRL 1 / QM 1276 / 107) TaxID=344612 RepID=A1CIA6_ASPCL|nr:MFS transporter, putative [Aspergillus clavatus NRRL 1]EAW10611.1 MFS transporter, putative [Aspergillus clavatus NRRL 1]